MKRSKPTNVASNGTLLKRHKKVKAGIDLHDPLLEKWWASEEVNSPPVGQTVDATKKLVRGKKTPAKQAKSAELKRPVNTFAKKKEALSAGSKGPKALLKDAGDLALITTPNTVKRRRSNPDLSTPLVLGLKCKAKTGPKSKKSKQLVVKSPQNVAEPEPTQSGVLLASKTTNNQVLDKEIDGDTSTNRKWGRTFTRNANRKTLFALNDDDNEHVISTKLPVKTGLELALQKEASIKLLKDHQELSSAEGNEYSDDEPISTRSASHKSTGKTRPLSNKDQNPSFEKKNSLWGTIASMEAFRLFPQNPHFSPLNNLNESARERCAMHKMVDFSTVIERTPRLTHNTPRIEIKDQLETLLELEAHGFEVGSLRYRLMEMLSLKDEAEARSTCLKEPRANIQRERVKIQERNRTIASIDRQRELLVKENEESELRIGLWEDVVDVHERAKGEYDRKFDELATTPF